MRPHPKLWKRVKWSGLLTCIVLAVVWLGSGWVTVWSGWRWISWLGLGGSADVSAGVLRVRESAPPDSPVTWDVSPHLIRRDFDLHWLPYRPLQSDRWKVELPLWRLVAPVLLATIAAGRLDMPARRRARAGCCAACGSARVGLPVARSCPRCGALPDSSKAATLQDARTRPHATITKTVKWGGLLACVGLAVAWSSSLWSAWGRSWEPEHPWREGHVWIEVGGGRIEFCRSLSLIDFKPDTGWFYEPGLRLPHWAFEHGAEPSRRWWTVPLWAPTVLLGLATVIAWRRDLVAHRSAMVGRCAACGYNRAGLPTASPCPECGAPLPPAAAPALDAAGA